MKSTSRHSLIALALALELILLGACSSESPTSQPAGENLPPSSDRFWASHNQAWSPSSSHRGS